VVAAAPGPVALKPLPAVVLMTSPPFVNAIVRAGIVRQIDGRRRRAGDRLARAREGDRAGSVVVEQDAGIGAEIVGDIA
jgi:hypothetical protein